MKTRLIPIALVLMLTGIGVAQTRTDPFSQINAKLDQLTAKLVALQTSVSAIDLTAENSELDGLGTKSDAIYSGITSLQSDVDGLKSDLSALSASVDSLKPPPPKTTTRLRVNFVENLPGFDTAMVRCDRLQLPERPWLRHSLRHWREVPCSIIARRSCRPVAELEGAPGKPGFALPGVVCRSRHV